MKKTSFHIISTVSMITLSCTFVIVCAFSNVSAHELSGVVVPDTLRIGPDETQLVLNESEVHKKFFIKVYVGALYLPARLLNSEEILDLTGAKSMVLHFLYSRVSGKRILDNWIKEFRGNEMAIQLESLRSRLVSSGKLFQNVYRGDIIRLDYLPGLGTEIWLNDKLIVTINGPDFYRALLKMWIGEDTVHESATEAMLGTSTE
jgi:hypothetical protein